MVVPPATPPLLIHKDTISLSILNVSFSAATIHVKNTQHNAKSQITVYRELNGAASALLSYPSGRGDTTYYDDGRGAGLIGDTLYRYYAILTDSLGIARDSSTFIEVRTLSPSSHNYTWQTITMGEWQSVFYDVWGSGENDVWAVGDIHQNGVYYGAIHYDGTSWAIDSTVGGYAIYGFAKDDIWVVGGSVFHFNGHQWDRIDSRIVNDYSIVLDSILFTNVEYTSVWGSSSTDMYFGSRRGNLVHWDGVKASLVPVSSANIADISGSDANHIYAVGWTQADDIAISYQNGAWTKEINKFPVPNFECRSVYAINEKERYVCGRGIMNGYSGHWARASVPLSPQFMKIRGSGANNIFAVGESSIVVHYNGTSWYTYNELFTGDNAYFYGIYCTGNKVFLVGETGDSKAKIVIGTKQ